MRTLLTGACLALALAGSAVAQQPAAQFMHLHSALNLSAAQEPAWSAYATAMTPDPQTDARHRATDRMLPSLPTPRRIALIEASTAQDMADMKRQGAAVLAFYSQLSPAQQQVFDAQTAPPATGSPPSATGNPPH